ncbi:MAG: translocation/assembly module TamB [Bacteroidales bacterium]|nr:translocation/assembly module TamB [Bacteroidales bacterium]
MIRIPSVQNYLTGLATDYVEDKTAAEVRLDKILISFPKDILLQGLYVGDYEKDTLFYAGELQVDVGIWDLLWNKIHIDEFSLKNATIRLQRRSADSNFNFQFILDSLSGTGKEKQEPTAEKQSMDFALGDISLENILFSYRDHVGGMKVENRVGLLEIEVGEVDLSKPGFGINEINLADSYANISITKKSPDSDTGSSAMPEIELKQLSLDDVRFRIKNEVENSELNVKLGRVDINADKTGLNEQRITLASLMIENTGVSYEFYSRPGQEQPGEEEAGMPETESWHISAYEAGLKGIDFSFNNKATEKQARGVDFQHLHIDGLNLQANELDYKGAEISVEVRDFSLREQSGFELQQLRADAYYNSKEARLDDLYMKTSNSLIRESLSVTSTSPGGITENLQKLELEVRLKNSRIAPDDIEYFVPGIFDELPVEIAQLDQVFLDADIQGRVEDIRIEQFMLRTMESVLIKAKGNLRGLPDAESLYMSLDPFRIRLTKTDLENLMADSLLTASVKIPEEMAISGELKGSLRDFKTENSINTSLGNLRTKISLQRENGQKPRYSAVIKSDTIALGKLLKNTTTFGPLKFELELTGEGFEPGQMKSGARLNIPLASFNNYTYRDVEFGLSADNDNYMVSGSIHDKYIDFVMDGEYVHDSTLPEIYLDLDLKAANLQALNLSERDLRVRGRLIADLEGSNTDNLNGKIKSKNALIVHNDELYPVDSLIFVAINDTAKTNLNIESTFLDASFKGNMKISMLGNSLQHHFNKYFFLGNDSLAGISNSQNFDFMVELKSSRLLKEIILPDLEEIETGKIKGHFDGEKEELSLDVNVPILVYGGNEIKSMQLSLRSDPQKLKSDFSIERLEMMGLHIDSLKLSSRARSDSLYNELQIKDREGDFKYRLVSVLTHNDTAYRLSFPGDRILLNYNEWSVPESNYILLGDFPARFRNISFSNGPQKVDLEMSREAFLVELSSFRLSNLTGILKTKTGEPVFNGIADGSLRIEQHAEGILLQANLSIDSSMLLGTGFGKMQIEAQQETPDKLTAELELSGKNEIRIIANEFSMKSQGPSELNLIIDKFALSTLQPMMSEQIKSISGFLKGELRLTNTLENPVLNGKLRLRYVNALFTLLGNRLNIPEADILVDNNDLTLDNIIIQDRQDNELTLAGTIKTDSLEKFVFDLNLQADHFTAIDQRKETDRIFYGRLTFSTNTDIKGPLSKPSINSDFTIEEDTDFKLSIQQASPSTVETEGIVEFVDKDRELNPILIDEEAAGIAFSASGIELNANIQTREDARFELIIDERAGDKLSIQGSSGLSLRLDESGRPTLTGRYNVSSGEYRLTLFNITRREFLIKENSYIMWTGNPMYARLYIDAVYNVRTAPINLISNQTGGGSASEMRQYKQKLPFNVNLMIRGHLLRPEISFGITLPPDKRNVFNGIVQARLNQLNQPGNESNLNKQVLGLLAFNQFMPQNPLKIEGGGFSSTARSSVSKLLSRQLNLFANKYIEGVNLTFDVRSYEDYTAEGAPEGRTELGVGLSKSFFNDRLEVRVGGNVELESAEYREETGFDDIAGDIVLVYKLTESGIYRVKAFRLSEYEQFEGSIIESGAALIFTKSFDTLKGFFKARNKEKDKEKEETSE